MLSLAVIYNAVLNDPDAALGSTTKDGAREAGSLSRSFFITLSSTCPQNVSSSLLLSSEESVLEHRYSSVSFSSEVFF